MICIRFEPSTLSNNKAFTIKNLRYDMFHVTEIVIIAKKKQKILVIVRECYQYSSHDIVRVQKLVKFNKTTYHIF